MQLTESLRMELIAVAAESCAIVAHLVLSLPRLVLQPRLERALRLALKCGFGPKILRQGFCWPSIFMICRRQVSEILENIPDSADHARTRGRSA